MALSQESPSSPPSSFYMPGLDAPEEEERFSDDELPRGFPMQSIDSQADDLAFPFHPTSRQGLGIDLSSHNSPCERPNDHSQRETVRPTVAVRRGQKVPSLHHIEPLESRGEEQTSAPQPYTPKPNPRSSSLPSKSSQQMPDTPLKRAHSREEDRQRMAAMDTIQSLSEQAQAGASPSDALPPGAFPLATHQPSPPPSLHQAGPSHSIEAQAGRTSRNSGFEFVRGPEGYRRKSKQSDDIASLRSPGLRPSRALSPTSAGPLTDGGIDSSNVSAFAYLPSGLPKPERGAIQHLDQHILSTNDFFRAVAALQFDPPTTWGQSGGKRRHDSGAALVFFALLTIIFATLFFVFEAPYLWHAFSPAVVAVTSYLLLLAVASFLRASIMDPGRLPQHLDTNPLTAANLGIQRQSFLLPDLDQLDEDSPRKHLALAKLRQQIKDVLPAPALRPPMQAGSPNGYSTPLRDGIRAIPLEDTRGRKTWLIYSGSETDILSPPRRALRMSFRKRDRKVRPRQAMDVEMQAAPRQVEVNQLPVQLRWCAHCQTHPSPRSFHCNRCSRCCQEFHYHCSWLKNDVGARNLPAFLAFLATATLTCIIVVVFAALHLARLAYSRDTYDRIPGLHLPGVVAATGSFRNAVAGSPTSVVLFAMGLAGCAFFVSRIGLHVICALQGQTVMQRVSECYSMPDVSPQLTFLDTPAEIAKGHFQALPHPSTNQSV